MQRRHGCRLPSLWHQTIQGSSIHVFRNAAMAKEIYAWPSYGLCRLLWFLTLPWMGMIALNVKARKKPRRYAYIRKEYDVCCSRSWNVIPHLHYSNSRNMFRVESLVVICFQLEPGQSATSNLLGFLCWERSREKEEAKSTNCNNNNNSHRLL